MPEFLLELFSEEIPARMQAQAGRDLARLFTEQLKAAGLTPTDLRAFAGPRRLTLVCDLPAATESVSEELKGPKATAPPQALEGFLRKTGLTREQLTERDGVLYAVTAREGRATAALVPQMVDAVIRGFPWPKSMRWGMGTLRWVRPLKRILCLFDSAVVFFAVDGVESGHATEGHRFMGPGGALTIRDFDDYQRQLADHFVVLDAEGRKARILDGAHRLCADAGLELVEDAGLLEEVAGLAEWPTPILGAMDPAFLDLPPEVIRTSMRTHQKYFAVRRAGEADRLAPHFLVVANIEPTDGGAEVARGNARVLSARLNDGRFFWNEDRKPGAFDGWLEKLKGVTFHAKLGALAERAMRIAALAREIAPLVGADPDLAEIAGRLCKADLASQMVGEFPELQGVMGGYYARALGQGDQIADAIRDHYRPQGPGDAVPTAPVTVAVALADKLDTLVGFFAIDEKPTGSKDPYALRRAALGVIRLIVENGLTPLPVFEIAAIRAFAPLNVSGSLAREYLHVRLATELYDPALETALGPVADLLAFFADRLKVLLRDQGRRHDLVDAVFALGDDDLVRIVRRVEALDAFLSTEDGANLLAGYRRAANILRAERKKNPDEPHDGDLELDLQTAPQEQALSMALTALSFDLSSRLEAEDFEGAMRALARLRAPVDAFFDGVLVNDPDPDVRLNRLRLLTRVTAAMNQVADFGQVSGEAQKS